MPLLVGVDEDVAVLALADAHGADRHGERDVRDTASAALARVHGEHVVGVLVVDRHGDRHQLGLAVPALGEERAERTVDHARGERGLLSGPALATEERAGDLARGVHALLDVDGEREEIHVALVAGCCGAEHHGVAGLDDDGSAGLLGELAGLESDLGTADLDRDAGCFRLHVLPFGRLRLAATCLRLSGKGSDRA